MSSIVVQTPPTAEPVTLQQLKSHLRIDIVADDPLLGIYLQAARELVESESGRSLVNKLYRQSHDRFPFHHEWHPGSSYTYRAPRYSHHWGDMRQAVKLLRCPLVSVQKITYLDTTGTLQTLLPAPEQWRAKAQFDKGAQIGDPAGYLQQVTGGTESEDGGASESGSAAPAWNATLAGTTSDGDLTWTNMGAAPAGDFLEDRDSEPPRLMPLYGQFWPLTQQGIPNAVQIYFTAGYGDDAADAPAALKVAVMQSAGVCYEHREAITPEQLRDMPWYERLIWSQRVLDWNPTR